jgi:2-isopropylmalate synthase
MYRISHAIAEIANIAPDTHQPYVGVSSFAHKAGLHASALRINADLYNHIDPSIVGNQQRVLVTEMAGRASVELKGKEIGMDLSEKPEVLSGVIERVKDLESRGWSFESADASFELLVRAERGEGRRFHVESWRTIVEQREDGIVASEATVKVHVNGERIVATGEGNGPVNALDNALRNAVLQIFPELINLELTDYKVRILDGVKGTGAVTRVLVETTSGSKQWTTIGVHENVIAASWQALDDAIHFGMIHSSDSPT